jgi:hypothetical protein
LRWLAVLLLLSAAHAFVPDGFCNSTAGESCMNSPDCSFCNVSAEVTVHYFDTYVLLSIEAVNSEPAEVPLVLSVRKDGELVKSMQLDLQAGQSQSKEVSVDRGPRNASLTVELRDRDIGTAWDFESLVVEGFEDTGSTEFLIPVVSVFAFLGILFFGFRYLRRAPGPYQIFPVFFPSYPAEPPPEEEIIIVPKKKKYYYKK